jgi:hypothetical protein
MNLHAIATKRKNKALRWAEVRCLLYVNMQSCEESAEGRAMRVDIVRGCQSAEERKREREGEREKPEKRGMQGRARLSLLCAHDGPCALLALFAVRA